MKNAVNERLANFIEYLGGSKVDFAGLIGETKYSLNNWLNDTKIPVTSLSNILIAYPELNARWLLTGEGEMIIGKKTYKENDSLMKVEEYGEKCKSCRDKDKTIEIMEKHIRLLEFSLGKNGKAALE